MFGRKSQAERQQARLEELEERMAELDNRITRSGGLPSEPDTLNQPSAAWNPTLAQAQANKEAQTAQTHAVTE